MDMQGLSPEAAGCLLSPAYLSSDLGTREIASSPPHALDINWTPFPFFQGTPSRLCTWKSGPSVTEERGKWDSEALLEFSNSVWHPHLHFNFDSRTEGRCLEIRALEFEKH